MVSDVEIKSVTISGTPTTCLVVSFNTDAGKQDINIPISQIFDANNYYNKTQADNTFVKPADLATVATTGVYSDLSGTPSLATVATSGSYTDLSNTPSIPSAQVNSDWNASSGVAEILNKPTIPTVPTNVSAFTNDAGYVTSSDFDNIGTATIISIVGAAIAEANKDESVISFDTDTASVDEGSTITKTVTVTAGDGAVTYSSSDTDVATVNNSGVITGVSTGTCTITASIASTSTYKAATASYTLTVTEPLANGVYAIYADGSMRTAENADTNAIGVAVITDNCKFIIDKTNNTTAAWDSNYSTNKVISGCFSTGNQNTAQTDYTGVSNTNAITAVASGGEAAKYCRSCSKTIAGKTVYGYLGACGEWKTVSNNYSKVTSIMSTIGGTAISSAYQWTSTQHSMNGRAWMWRYEYNSGTYGDKDAYYEVRPFYSLD